MIMLSKRLKMTVTMSLLLTCMVLPSSSRAGNTGQNTVSTKVVSATIAASSTWQQVAKSDPARATMLCQNVGSNDMGFVITSMTNGNVAPSGTIGSAGVFTMAAKVSYEADGGWMPGGEIWIIGTMSDVMTCNLSPSQP